MTHLIWSETGAFTVIEPSTKLTLEVRSNPSVSLTKASAHFTEYTPGSQFSGTLYESVMIVALLAATTPVPALWLNRNFFSSVFSLIF